MCETALTMAGEEREALAVINSCVRGHHVYKARWTPVLGEQLQCHREVGNERDRYTMAVKKDTLTVGHWVMLETGHSAGFVADTGLK